MITQSITTQKLQKVVKSLRLIRLIRIIKLYKYIVQSKKDTEDQSDPNFRKRQQKKKKSKLSTEEDDLSEQSLFKRETDPSKLGKVLQDSSTRRMIIGILLMLMVLPLLTYSEIDFSSEYGLRELFWFGRSSCKQQ